MRHQIEIERVHPMAGGAQVCDEKDCPRGHQWALYLRAIDRHALGYGPAQWIADYDSRDVALDTAQGLVSTVRMVQMASTFHEEAQ